MPLYKELYRVALHMLGDSNEAEDAVQNLFVKLWERRDTLGSKEAITFLFPLDVTAGFLPAPRKKQNKKCRKSTEATKKREASGGPVVRVEETENAFFVVTTGEPHRVLSTYFKHHGPHAAKVLARTTAEEINKLWND